MLNIAGDSTVKHTLGVRSGEGEGERDSLRGFSWANGEFRTTLYNHARRPNDAALDCLSALMTTPDKAKMYAGYGWRAARSRHRGGVNLVLADTAVRFIDDAVDPAVWKAAATRAGGEATPLP